MEEGEEEGEEGGGEGEGREGGEGEEVRGREGITHCGGTPILSHTQPVAHRVYSWFNNYQTVRHQYLHHVMLVRSFWNLLEMFDGLTRPIGSRGEGGGEGGGGVGGKWEGG